MNIHGCDRPSIVHLYALCHAITLLLLLVAGHGGSALRSKTPRAPPAAANGEINQNDGLIGSVARSTRRVYIYIYIYIYIHADFDRVIFKRASSPNNRR